MQRDYVQGTIQSQPVDMSEGIPGMTLPTWQVNLYVGAGFGLSAHQIFIVGLLC